MHFHARSGHCLCYKAFEQSDYLNNVHLLLGVHLGECRLDDLFSAQDKWFRKSNRKCCSKLKARLLSSGESCSFRGRPSLVSHIFRNLDFYSREACAYRSKCTLYTKRFDICSIFAHVLNFLPTTAACSVCNKHVFARFGVSIHHTDSNSWQGVEGASIFRSFHEKLVIAGVGNWKWNSGGVKEKRQDSDRRPTKFVSRKSAFKCRKESTWLINSFKICRYWQNILGIS